MAEEKIPSGPEETGPEAESETPKKEAGNPGRKPPKKKKTGMALVLRDLTGLLIKIGLILLVVVLAFTFLFGAFRNADPGMLPAIKDGDLVFYYRLDKYYHSGDVVAAKYNGRTITLRVAAVAGDVVADNHAQRHNVSIHARAWRATSSLLLRAFRP